MDDDCYDEIQESQLALIERADKAEKELSELKERTRWIPVSERLPELNEHGFPPEVMSIDEELSIRNNCCFLEESQKPEWHYSYPAITHWMELPLPPNE